MIVVVVAVAEIFPAEVDPPPDAVAVTGVLVAGAVVANEQDAEVAVAIIAGVVQVPIEDTNDTVPLLLAVKLAVQVVV